MLAALIAFSSLGLAQAAAAAEPGTPPWIRSDKDDYPPGALVQLTGGDWQPGEAVHVVVNDDQGRTWERAVDVVAGDSGDISDSFNLPDWFVATYQVLATGELSGTAVTGFTDGNVKVGLAAGVTATLQATLYGGTTSCSGGTTTAKTVPGTVGVGSSDSLQLTAAATTTSGSRPFTEWTVLDGTQAVPFIKLDPEGRTICVPGFANGGLDAVAHYADPVTATNLSAVPASGVYGGTTTLTATLRTAGGSAIAGRTVSFALGGTPVGTGTTNSSGLAAVTANLGATAVGTYANHVSAAFAGDLSFGSANATAALTVAKAPLAVSADDKSKTYGEANPTLTYSVTGLVAGDSKATALQTAPSLGTAAASAGAGTYAINVSGASSANYALSYTPGNLVVSKAQLVVQADDKGRAYGDANPALTYRVSGLANGDTETAALPTKPTLATAATASSAKGTYPITVTGGAPSANYTLARQDGMLTVAERAITVTAAPQTKTYGTTDPALTYTVSKGSLATGDSLTGSLDRAAGQAVGSYRIGQGTLTAGANYAITFEPASLAVTPRAITVAAEAKSKVYGDADPAFTYTTTSGSLAFDDTFTGSLERNAGQAVGSYTINRGTLSAGLNYDLTFTGAILTVTARPITVTADSQEKVYGDADPKLTYKITSGSLQGADDFQGSLSRLPGQQAGSYDIGRGTLTAGDNYQLTFVGAKLIIAIRAITVTADPHSKVYGDADPVFTYKITAGQLANGDTLTGAPRREPGEDVGTYAIHRGSLTAGDDYLITFESATLSVGGA
jgi:hypothetical protein